MTRYMLNKFMCAIEMSDKAVARYIADPRAEVQAWLAGSAGPDQVTDDRRLTDEEVEAFATCDYGTLYRLGAHPYLLWHFTEAVRVHESSWPELKERYRRAVQPHGYPDFTV